MAPAAMVLHGYIKLTESLPCQSLGCIRVKITVALMVVTGVTLTACVFIRKEGRNALFTDTLNTFYYCHIGVGHMTKNHIDRETRNLLLLHGLLFSIDSKGSFIYTIPQTGYHILVVRYRLECGKSPMIGPLSRFTPTTQASQTSALTTELYPTLLVYLGKKLTVLFPLHVLARYGIMP